MVEVIDEAVKNSFLNSSSIKKGRGRPLKLEEGGGH